MKKSEREYWRDIPGFDGLYQASTKGRIRRVWPKSKKITILQTYTHNRGKTANRNAIRVHITMPNGKRVERTVIKLVAETFLRVPEGKRAVHRNGLKADNSLENIIFLSNQEIGERFGSMATRRPVIKVNRAGEIVECYASARQAARMNYMSYQTVMDRCNNKVKQPYELNGYNYQWENNGGK